MKEFFKNLPYNTSKIYSEIYIKESDCLLYIPAVDVDTAKKNKDTLSDYFNSIENILA